MKPKTKRRKAVIQLGAQNNPRLKANIIIVSIFLLVGIGYVIFKSQTKDVPTLVSLKDNWDILQATAYNWQNDAYLTDVSFDSTGQDPAQLSAEYHSHHINDRTLIIWIDSFGRVNTVPLKLSPLRSGAQDQVYREDWIIDSQEALNSFLKDETISSCLRRTKTQWQMSLNSVGQNEVTWSLFIVNCPEEGKAKFYDLNAKTGELTENGN